MSNSAKTVVLISCILSFLIVGWFAAAATLCVFVGATFGFSFSWLCACAAFGLIVVMRMFYGRNVFSC